MTNELVSAVSTNQLKIFAIPSPVIRSLFMLVRWRYFRFSRWGLLQSTAVLQQPLVEFQQPTFDFPLVIYSSRKGLKRPYNLHSIHGPKNKKILKNSKVTILLLKSSFLFYSFFLNLILIICKLFVTDGSFEVK